MVENLVERIRQKDQRAMSQLYQMYIRELSSVCYRFVPSQSDAKDVLQESFVKIFASIPTLDYRGENAFRIWMRKVVVNEALHFLRERRKLKASLGLRIVEPDLEKAAGYYLQAAEAGNADGQFCIGLMYANGAGVGQDYAEAAKWYTAAAEQGEPDSMYHLAFLYNDGLGVEKDPAMVAYYLYLAADRGFQPAIDAINKNRIPRPEIN